MPKGVILDPGAGGDTIAADEIAAHKYQRIKLISGVDGVNDGDVAATNPLPVKTPGKISTDNSTTATLGIGAVYTGTFEAVVDRGSIGITVFADVASAADGFTVEWSQDGTNVETNLTDSYTIAANTAESFPFTVEARFYRVKYTNGGAGQATFRLESILKDQVIMGPVHPIESTIDGNTTVGLVTRSVLVGKKPDNSYTNIEATAAGHLKFSLEEINGVTMPTNQTQVGGTAVDANIGNAGGGTQRVVLASDQPTISTDSFGEVDTGNSTTTPLGIGGTFIGVGKDITNCSSVAVTVFSDVASAIDGLNLEFSIDNTNWDIINPHNLLANKGRPLIHPPEAQFFRIRFVNGAIAQTVFRLEVVLKSTQTSLVDVGVGGTVIDDSEAIAVRAIITAKNPGGNYVNVGATNGGSIKTDLTEFDGNAPSLNSGVVDGGTLRVVLPTDQPAITVDLGANNDVTATGNVAHDAVDSGSPIKIGGRAQEPTAALEEVADNDRVDAAYDRQGRTAVWMGYPVLSADINDAISGDNTIVAAGGAGLRIAVIGYHLVSDGTVDFRWEDGASGTAKTGQISLEAREGMSAGYGFHPMWTGAANALLNLELSAAIRVHGQVSYVLMTD